MVATKFLRETGSVTLLSFRGVYDARNLLSIVDHHTNRGPISPYATDKPEIPSSFHSVE